MNLPLTGDSPEIASIERHLAGTMGMNCPRATLAAMLMAALRVSTEPFEGRALRPVFRWHESLGVTADAASELAVPVSLTDSRQVRRLAAAWGSPGKLLVSQTASGGAVTALAAEAGIWAGPIPSVLVEPLSPGAAIVSSYSRTVASLSYDNGVECILDPQNDSFRQLVQRATGMTDEACTALHVMVLAVREHQFGGIFIVDPSASTGTGVGLKATWSLLENLQGRMRQGLASTLTSAGGPDSGTALHLGNLWRRVAEAVGRLAGTDGAVILDGNLGLKAFGAHLALGAAPISYVEGTVVVPAPLVSHSTSTISGTRHSAAIHHVASNPQSMAVVVSHDGPVSLVTHDGTRVRIMKRVELLLPTLDG